MKKSAREEEGDGGDPCKREAVRRLGLPGRATLVASTRERLETKTWLREGPVRSTSVSAGVMKGDDKRRIRTSQGRGARFAFGYLAGV